MVGSIGSNSMISQMQISQNSNYNNSLSTTQLETVSSVLENYDSNNLSANDASSIVSVFQSAGIQPGRALESAMSAAGFDAKDIGLTDQFLEVPLIDNYG